MLSMHEEEKEVVIYVTTEKINAQEDEVGEDGSVGRAIRQPASSVKLFRPKVLTQTCIREHKPSLLK